MAYVVAAAVDEGVFSVVGSPTISNSTAGGGVSSAVSAAVAAVSSDCSVSAVVVGAVEVPPAFFTVTVIEVLLLNCRGSVPLAPPLSKDENCAGVQRHKEGTRRIQGYSVCYRVTNLLVYRNGV